MRTLRSVGSFVLLCALLAHPVATASAEAVRPNVLLIISDDQAWSNFSRPMMPRVFSDIVDRGTLFDRAYVTSPVCCPSRSEMLTGLYEHHTGVDGNSVALDRPTLPMALHDAGYRTMLAGKYLNSWSTCAPRPEFDRWSCVGTPAPSTYSQIDPWINVDGSLTHFTGYQTDILAHQVVDFVSATPSDQPFFAIYAPTTPHSPADDPRYGSMPVSPWRPPSYDAETRTAQTPVYAHRFPLGSGTVAGTDRFYRSTVHSVRALDDAVGTLLDGLGDRADNTLVIYMSDNGYLFGEHRRVGKFDAYEEAVRVPMAVRYPAVLDPADAWASDLLVSNVDLAPTIAQAAGLAWEADGASLLPLLSPAGSAIHDAVLIERCQGQHMLKEPCNAFTFENGVVYPPAFVGIVTATHKYVEYSDGGVQLFDLVADPSEMVNLVGRPETAAIQSSLATRLHAMRAAPPPQTTIVTGPAGPVSQRSVGFSFFSQSRFSSYRCRLIRDSNADPWHDCSTGTDVVGGLDDGSYVFEVAGTDEHGATDPTPASRAFQVMTSGGPPVSVTSGPSGAQTSHDAAFGFSSPVPGATFECRLVAWGGHDRWQPCDPDNGATYTVVGDGVWNFEVRAIDPVSGDESDPPASRLLIVDDTGPTFSVWSRPPTTTTSGDAAFGFTPLEAVSGGLSCSVDHGAASDCSNDTFAVRDLTPGLHTFSVQARDLLGTTRTTSLTWTIDRTLPTVAIVAKPKAFVASTSATFGFSSDETPAMFVCRVDAFLEMPCSLTWTIGPLTNGSHGVTVRALDQAGQRSLPATWNWTVDLVRPIVTLSGGPGEGSRTTATRASFSFVANEPVTFRCTLDLSAPKACTSPRTYTGLAPGAHTFSVTATDRAGNTSVAKIRHWTVST